MVPLGAPPPLCCLLPSASNPWQTPGHRAGGWVGNANSSTPRVTLAPRTVISGHTWPHPGLSALGTPPQPQTRTHTQTCTQSSTQCLQQKTLASAPSPRDRPLPATSMEVLSPRPQHPPSWPTTPASQISLREQPHIGGKGNRLPPARCSAADPLARRTQTPRRCRLSRPPACSRQGQVPAWGEGLQLSQEGGQRGQPPPALEAGHTPRAILWLSG